jgi:SAM-dependent methyltransferase
MAGTAVNERPGFVGASDDRFLQAVGPEVYMASAYWCLERIQLARHAAGLPVVRRVLDFGCGWGRVLRVLREDFPEADFVACDMHKPAADFSAESFGALPVYDEAELEGPFDLMWAGSVFTHLDENRWNDLLALAERLVCPGGLFVFTTQGRFAADLLRREGGLGLTEEQVDEVLRQFDSTGFGYVDYQFGDSFKQEKSLPDDYGISLSLPSWVCGKLETVTPKFDVMLYASGGFGTRWGRLVPPLPMAPQDVVGCTRLA